MEAVLIINGFQNMESVLYSLIMGFLQIFQRPDYVKLRKEHPRVPILGGVRFKYQAKSGLSLAQEVAVARNKCDAIVTTGDGTGIETPLDKLRLFRELIGDFPLVVGARSYCR